MIHAVNNHRQLKSILNSSCIRCNHSEIIGCVDDVALQSIVALVEDIIGIIGSRKITLAMLSNLVNNVRIVEISLQRRTGVPVRRSLENYRLLSTLRRIHLKIK